MPERDSIVHDLKVWPPWWQDMAVGNKTFEIRHRNGRDFRVNDFLHLIEIDAVTNQPTGREMVKRVTYIISGMFGIPEDVVVMAVH